MARFSHPAMVLGLSGICKLRIDPELTLLVNYWVNFGIIAPVIA